jgi:hypothetical protein
MGNLFLITSVFLKSRNLTNLSDAICHQPLLNPTDSTKNQPDPAS